MSTQTPAPADAPSRHECPPIVEAIRNRVGALMLRFGPLRVEIAQLAEWLELEILPAVEQDRAESADVTVVDGALEVHVRGRAQPVGRLMNCPALCEFLGEVGIDHIDVGPRLESNQISDLLGALYVHRRRVARRDGGHLRLIRMLLEDQGMHYACTETHLADRTLTIRYSYCTLRYSRLVGWFEKQNRHFGDHRALFRAAPWLALMPVAVLLIGMGVLWLADAWWVRVLAGLFGAGAIYALTYLFCMIVGSIEYDKEERAFRLRSAYDELHRYTQRIRKDLSRAQAVQQRLLPDADAMPLPDRLVWASHFCPEIDVGGDYFDAAEIPDGKMAFVFADVSGHGMAAAFITALIKTAFQHCVEHGESLEMLIALVNRNLLELTPDDSFAALIAGAYDPVARRLMYVNCGHAPGVILIPADTATDVQALPDSGTMILGVLDDPGVNVLQRDLAPGDRVFLSTDGNTEAMNVSGSMFSQPRLLELLHGVRGRELQAIVDVTVESVDEFSAGADQTDDRAILAFEVRP